MGKIFGIGLPRTGTTSLKEALTLLGIPSIHWVREDLLKHALRMYTGLCEMPVTTRYQELDRRCPDSKFILTVLESEDWLESCRRWYLAHPPQGPLARSRIELFGTPHFDPTVFTRLYATHHATIDEYFRSRPGTLLKINICRGEGWEKLAPFLGMPVPSISFPHSNKSPG